MRLARAVLVVVLLTACTADGDDTETVRSGADAEDTAVTGGPPLIGDHWHVATELSVCGDALPDPVDAGPDESGIHAHGDGLIHIHPFVEEFTGEGAVLGAFLDTIGAEVDDGGLRLADETDVPFEGECDGEPAHLQVARWASADDDAPEVTVVASAGAVRSVRLDEDGMAIAVGLVVEGEELPLPASAATEPTDLPTAPPATGQGTDNGPVEGFAIAPVLGTGASPCGPSAVAGEDGTCYELGPVGLGPDAVESAEPLRSAGDWTVGLVLTAPGLDAFNELAQACFDMAATCPSGQLAIVVGDEVLSAPTVQAPSFERDAIVISGGFGEAEATALAATIAP